MILFFLRVLVLPCRPHSLTADYLYADTLFDLRDYPVHLYSVVATVVIVDESDERRHSAFPITGAECMRGNKYLIRGITPYRYLCGPFGIGEPCRHHQAYAASSESVYLDDVVGACRQVVGRHG